MENLSITLVQSKLIWEDPKANRRHLGEKMAGLAGETDLIILPEMFSTGFTMAAENLAEPMQGPTLDWLSVQSRQTGAVVTGSIIVREGENCYNRLIWMRPDGSHAYYDKRHLFTLAGEHQHYAAGQQRLSVELRGWRICPLICYDLRFPVWSRNTTDYDLLLYVANWPERRTRAWRSLLCARAIENQAYTVGVNRVGEDGNEVYYAGHSSLYDYAGQRLYETAHLENVFTTRLSKEPLQQFRRKFRFLADRDTFELPGMK